MPKVLHTTISPINLDSSIRLNRLDSSPPFRSREHALLLAIVEAGTQADCRFIVFAVGETHGKLN